MDIQIGAPGQIIPPVDRGVALGIKMEKLGYDALWWPDHLMGWRPDSMWNEDDAGGAAVDPRELVAVKLPEPTPEVRVRPHVYQHA
nr:hypothetical protein [Verrucomicrobiota bacterium]